MERRKSKSDHSVPGGQLEAFLALLPGRGVRGSMYAEIPFALAAAYAYVFEAEGAEAGGVEEIFGVDDEGLF